MRLCSFITFASLNSLVLANQNSFTPSIDASPNPSGRFEAKTGKGIYILGEALLMQPTQDDFPIATLGNIPQPVSQENPTLIDPVFSHDTIYNYRTKWKWGFKVLLGYHLNHDEWDLEANYLRFNNSYNTLVLNEHILEKTLYAAPQGTILSPNKVNNQIITFKWGINLNQWDVDLARTYFVSKYLRLQPLFGLRNVLFGQSFLTKAYPDVFNYLQSKTSMHFWGMGALVGLNSIWNLNRQFSLRAGFKAASLFGDYHPHLKDGIYFENSNITVRDTDSTKRSNKTMFDLLIGVAWDKNFYKDKLHLGINVCFEQYTYINMNQGFYGVLNQLNYSGVSGRDFSLQGFSFGIRADF